ncbi:tyrosine-type recombinase/integrase [Kribbella sp. NPDC026596]|uniref:tyrosine-type recombinase/integrase n=1 Tax=Kribbella sp. NPDC026596 TaxID=3155122 RepID=UPI0033C895FE
MTHTNGSTVNLPALVRPPDRHPPRSHLLRRGAAAAGRARRRRRPGRCRQPIRFTPHDFRRLFTTEMVSSGLPLHIAATLLGHLNLDTTCGYTAMFPDEVITAHQFFIERRRTLRPFGEMRPASGEEWDEFEQHFLLRKVALGDCHRPYGTPCVHEHACSRCRFLRVDPAQLPRIEEMTANATERLTEAQERAWLGEVAALEDSLKHLRQRRVEAEQQLKTTAPALPHAGG